jgi:AcrR family transcriptional regulator
MCPRPRKASDEEVFAAAVRVMSRVGPAQLTLTEIAAEAGLTASALVQRFGSKRRLLVTLAEQAAAGTHEMFAEIRAAHPSPLAALRAWAECYGHMGDSSSALARNFSYLLNDLTDPDLRPHTVAQARATRAELRELLDAAVAAGELAPGVDTGALARGVEVTVSGSMLTWAFHEEGALAAWIREDLENVLRPYLAASGEAPR